MPLLVPVAPSAALPPNWQSAREIAGIVDDKRVHDALKYEEPILSIGSTAADAYEVTHGAVHADGDGYLQDGETRPHGARQFDLDVGEATCR